MTRAPRRLRELAVVRDGPVVLASYRERQALKAQLLARLQTVATATSRRVRRQRQQRVGSVSIAVIVVLGGVLAVVSRGAGLRAVASHDAAEDWPASTASMLRVEPSIGAQLVWSGATTELRRLTTADHVPLRGKLAVIGERSARLHYENGTVVELGGYTRVSLEGAQRTGTTPAFGLEQGSLQILSGAATVRAGSAVRSLVAGDSSRREHAEGP